MDQGGAESEIIAQPDTPELTENTKAPNQPEALTVLQAHIESPAIAPSVTREADVIPVPDTDEKPAGRTHKTHRKAPVSKKSKKTRTWTPPRRKPTRAALMQQHRTRNAAVSNTGVVQPMTMAPEPDWLEDALEWHPQATGFGFERCLARLWDQLERTGLPLDRSDPLDQTCVRTNLARYFKTAEKPDNDWALSYVMTGQQQRLGVIQRSARINLAPRPEERSSGAGFGQTGAVLQGQKPDKMQLPVPDDRGEVDRPLLG